MLLVLVSNLGVTRYFVGGMECFYYHYSRKYCVSFLDF